MSETMVPQDDMQNADQLDRLITARQQVAARVQPLATLSADEATLVDGLIHLAATTAPAPDFVAALAQQLQNQARLQPAQPSTWRWQTLGASINHWITPWQFTPRKVAFAAILLFCLLIGFYAAPPTARATFWDWLYGFGLLREEQIAEQAIPIAVPALTPTTANALTLAEIQSQAPFAVLPPTQLPAGLFFTSGFVMDTATGTVVTLAYHISAASAGGYPLAAPLLFIAISDTEIPNRPLLAAGYQQPVRVGEQAGVYTHGNWRSTTPSVTGDTETGPLVWDSTLDAAWLVWQKDGLHYLVYAQELAFTSQEMILIAQSMQ